MYIFTIQTIPFQNSSHFFTFFIQNKKIPHFRGGKKRGKEIVYTERITSVVTIFMSQTFFLFY